jgi:hypothetical protein
MITHFSYLIAKLLLQGKRDHVEVVHEYMPSSLVLFYSAFLSEAISYS